MKAAVYIAIVIGSIVVLYYGCYLLRLVIFWMTGGGTEPDDYTD